MPHLNELSEKYDSKGLTVLALTSEGTGPTEKWIQEKGAKYPYGYDKGGALAREVGVSGIPAAILIDPTGQVVWQGHPSELGETQLDEAVKGALAKPAYTWPAELSGVRKALAKSQFKKALDDAAKQPAAQDAGVIAAIEGMVKGRLEGLKGTADRGDFLTASELIPRMKKDLAGLPALDEVAAVEKQIAANPDAKNVMKAQAKVRKLKETPIRTPKDVTELLEQVEKLAKKNQGNAAGAEADEFAESLRKKLG